MKVLLIGGDSRQIYCAGRLALLPDTEVSMIALKEDDDRLPGQTLKPDIIILPYVSATNNEVNTPLSHLKITLDDVESYIKSGCTVFCGKLPSERIKGFEALGAKVSDWFGFEELTLKNAGLTAEGAAQLITSRSDKAVSGSTFLITGWGRVAKACAKLFKAMGGKVCIAARREEARLEAKSYGYDTAGFINLNAINNADIIVNTVPERVFGTDELKALRKGSWILELASKPYGLDFDMAKDLGVTAVLGAGLPGKYTPEKAGLFMAETIISELSMPHKGGKDNG